MKNNLKIVLGLTLILGATESQAMFRLGAQRFARPMTNRLQPSTLNTWQTRSFSHATLQAMPQAARQPRWSMALLLSSVASTSATAYTLAERRASTEKTNHNDAQKREEERERQERARQEKINQLKPDIFGIVRVYNGGNGEQRQAYLNDLDELLKQTGPNIRDEHNETLLDLTYQYHPDIVQLLIKHGIDVDASYNAQETPLMRNLAYPAHDKRADTIALALIKAGANVTVMDDAEATLCELAMKHQRSPKIVRALVEAGAPVDEPTHRELAAKIEQENKKWIPIIGESYLVKLLRKYQKIIKNVQQ
jgi:ribosomal protein L12E/L44/L45/RPP1/RPP2